MKKYNVGDLVKQRGIDMKNPPLGVVLGWDDTLDLVKIQWSHDKFSSYKNDAGEELEHPEMLELVYRPMGHCTIHKKKFE